MIMVLTYVNLVIVQFRKTKFNVKQGLISYQLNGYQESSEILEILVARILFKKIIVMPKGQSPKIKSSICNTPISDIVSNCNSLPRPADIIGVIVVKLKRKVEYRDHVLFQPVRPSIIESF